MNEQMDSKRSASTSASRSNKCCGIRGLHRATIAQPPLNCQDCQDKCVSNDIFAKSKNALTVDSHIQVQNIKIQNHAHIQCVNVIFCAVN